MIKAPSASELQNDPTVQTAFAAAWADTFPDDEKLRHEEGGFIYFDTTNGEIAFRRAPPGFMEHLDISKPPAVLNSYLIGVYHTHPNSPAVGWMPDPSPEDYSVAKQAGVPFFMITEDRIYAIGPKRRVGGCVGPSGYPI